LRLVGRVCDSEEDKDEEYQDIILEDDDSE